MAALIKESKKYRNKNICLIISGPKIDSGQLKEIL